VHIVTTERVSLAGNRPSVVILSLRRTTDLCLSSPASRQMSEEI